MPTNTSPWAAIALARGDAATITFGADFWDSNITLLANVWESNEDPYYPPHHCGSRSNLVLWLYGERIQIPTTHPKQNNLTSQQRWPVPDTAQDEYVPF